MMERKPDDAARDDAFDIDTLLHPANAFARPMDIVNDADLTLTEKRAMLASWASDACAVEAMPALRHPPGTPPVHFDEIMDALKELDRIAGSIRPRPHYRRVLAQRVPGVFGRKDDDNSGERGPMLS
jgi:hypothetical protein